MAASPDHAAAAAAAASSKAVPPFKYFPVDGKTGTPINGSSLNGNASARACGESLAEVWARATPRNRRRTREALASRAPALLAAMDACKEAQLLLQQLQESTNSLASSLQAFHSNADPEIRSPRPCIPSITVEYASQDAPTKPQEPRKISDENGGSGPPPERKRRSSAMLYSTPKLEAPAAAGGGGGDSELTDHDVSDHEAAQDAIVTNHQQRASVGATKRASLKMDNCVAESRKRGSMPRPSLDMPSNRGPLRTQKTDRTYSDIDHLNSGPGRVTTRKTDYFRRQTRRGSSMRRTRPTDCSDGMMEEIDINDIHSSSPSESSDDVSDDDITECEKKSRRGGVSAPASGQFNRRLADHRVREHPKGKEYIEMIEGALTYFPFLDTDPDGIRRLALAMEIVKYVPGENIITQGEYGRNGYIILSGEADVYVGGEFKRRMVKERFFGEFTMLFGFKRGATVTAVDEVEVAKLKRDDFFELATRREMEARSLRENYLRNLRMFDTLGPEDIAKVADAMEEEIYKKGSPIIRQGDYGDEMFLVISGECQAECRIGKDDVQKHRHYRAGDRFGEKAFIERAKRAATVTAITDCKVLCLRRSAFRRMLGNLDEIQQEHYMHDPRKTIADFYRSGNSIGPRGVAGPPPEEGVPHASASEWFAIYRPTSRDAIAKMLSGTAVGKGLNVKGKSSKKNHLSGFVPFLQISEDKHKAEIEESPPGSKVTIFYQNKEARSNAERAFRKLLAPEAGLELQGPTDLVQDDSYPNVYGLVVHERVMRQVYIIEPPLAFTVGWETGRPSVPAFMDMNLHAIRDATLPRVVLYQFDSEHALNPHGLLIAYAETFVKPVVSDFDTFTVGSRGMTYATLSVDQQKLALQTLKHTEEILKSGKSNWSSAWIDILKTLPHDALPALPKYGFGDKTSIDLIEAVINATQESGAVRHGAECFNFGFPQELDDEFLIIWEKFDDKPWRSTDKDGLKTFLFERAREGFSFPLNPVWPVRDEGWYDIYRALRDNPANTGSFNAWYPPSSGIASRVEELHKKYPGGFAASAATAAVAKAAPKVGAEELDGLERADFEQKKLSKNWRRLRGAMTMVRRISHAPDEKSPENKQPGKKPDLRDFLAAKQPSQA